MHVHVGVCVCTAHAVLLCATDDSLLACCLTALLLAIGGPWVIIVWANDEMDHEPTVELQM